MALDFEKLATAVADMVQQTSRRRGQQEGQLQEAKARLQTNAASWDLISNAVEQALERGEQRSYRAAVPLYDSQALDSGLAAPPAPPRATILACDGSQIVPDRHAPFLYYLINTGLIAYYHGSGEPPDVFSEPELVFPREDEREEDDIFTVNSGVVGLRRDRFEINALSKTLPKTRSFGGPKLAVLDQRLLYWPASGLPERDSEEAIREWQVSMSAIRDAGGWLAGFIDRPGKRSVLSMLHTLDIMQPGFDVKELYRKPKYHLLSDVDLYALFLAPGERSAVFREVSQLNTRFRNEDENNEVCFFYLRTGDGEGELARVDIPMWVAEKEETVATVHALIYDQCQILGRYPYAITRADEVAVVGRREREELEQRIASGLAQKGIYAHVTSKQLSKNLARSEKGRHSGIH